MKQGVMPEFAADVLYGKFEESSTVCHLSNLAVLEGSLIHTRTGLSVPSLDVATELGAGVKHTVVPVLVVNRSGQRVSEHALFQRRQTVYWVVAQELGCGR
jgi:hypothetical protein